MMVRVLVGGKGGVEVCNSYVSRANGEFCTSLVLELFSHDMNKSLKASRPAQMQFIRLKDIYQ